MHGYHALLCPFWGLQVEALRTQGLPGREATIQTAASALRESVPSLSSSRARQLGSDKKPDAAEGDAIEEMHRQ